MLAPHPLPDVLAYLIGLTGAFWLGCMVGAWWERRRGGE